MELRDYLRVLRRRWRLIAGCFLATLGLAAVVTFQATPLYTSTARLFISTTPGSASEAYAGGLFSAQRVTSYASLATGQELSQRVISELDLEMEPAELARMVKADVDPDSVILNLSVTDADPDRAQQLTTAVAHQLADYVAELETPPGRENPLLKASIVDPPTLPEAPSSPQPLRNIGLGAVLGLLLGFGAAVLRELLDQTVKQHEEAADITGVPVIAGIGYDAGASKNPLITALDSHAPRAEAFRVLRTNLQFVDVDAASKAFVVTSSVAGEGKSTTATNVALALAQAGQSVLLIDGDLRRPQVARMLGMDQSIGLTTVLVGGTDLSNAVQQHPTGLSVLASGSIPPNPAELLQSHAMRDLVGEFRTQFQVVIIDAPPLLPVTDAALLTAHADGALLVVRHGHTTRDQLRGSVQRLAAVDARAVGVVFNMVPTRGGSYGYGYGYGYGEGYGPVTTKSEIKTKRRGRRKAAFIPDDVGQP